MPFPITIVAAGGIAITETDIGTPMTPVTSGGFAVTRVASGGLPVRLVNNDLSPWVEGGGSGAGVPMGLLLTLTYSA